MTNQNNDQNNGTRPTCSRREEGHPWVDPPNNRKHNLNICPIRTAASGKPTAHWWIIEGQHGETSTGKCRFCPAEKVFINSSYHNDINKKRSAKKRRDIIQEAVEREI